MTAARPRGTGRIERIVGALAFLTGMALAPPLFSRLFAMGPLVGDETALLWAGAGVLVLLSVALLAASWHVPRPLVGLLFGALVVIGFELGARAAVNALLPEATHERLAWLANRTYPQLMRARPHPFLQYVGNRRVNNLGFGASHDFHREKPGRTVRIACMGGSTTADGNWPAIMEELLRDDEQAARRFEVMNFAVVGHSSAHVMINFFLNVVEYDPDYVVLHTGWNDTVFRGRAGEVLSDFSDVFKPFQYPVIRDRWLLRTSVIYRYLANRSGKAPPWADVAPAIYHDRADKESFENVADLVVYRRNLEKILDFAAHRGIRIVLATQPYATKPGVPNAEEARHIDQCNAIMREIHERHPGTTLLVDLDEAMTGVYNGSFGDLGHLDREGRTIKARAVRSAILADLTS